MDELIPTAMPPRRLMKQPSKGDLRDQLAAAHAEVERLTAELNHLRTPWWRRLYRRMRAARKEQS